MPGGLEMRRAVLAACRRLHDRGLVAGTDGNVSVRLSSGRILVTPTGVSKADVSVEDLVELAADGTSTRRSRKPSSELGMHLRIYRRRPDVNAVVHAHPPVATGLGVAGVALDDGVLPELVLQAGRVPLVPYATPGTEAVGDALEPWLQGHEAFLLANHGATTVGTSIDAALHRMESLEHAARILLTARLLGNVNRLTDGQLAELQARRSAAAPLPLRAPAYHPAESRRKA